LRENRIQVIVDNLIGDPLRSVFPQTISLAAFQAIVFSEAAMAKA
jgi:hypothetical protein